MRTFIYGNYTLKAFNTPCYAGEKNLVILTTSSSVQQTVTLSFPTLSQTVTYIVPPNNVELIIDFSAFINSVYALATGSSLAFSFTLAGITVSSTVFGKRRYEFLVPPRGVINVPSDSIRETYFFALYSNRSATYSQQNAQNVSFTDLQLQYGIGFQYLLFKYIGGIYTSLTRFRAIDDCAKMGGLYLDAQLFDSKRLTFFFFIDGISEDIVSENYIIRSDDMPRKRFVKRRTWTLTTGHTCDQFGKRYLLQFADAQSLGLRYGQEQATKKIGAVDPDWYDIPVRLAAIDEATPDEAPFTLQVYQDLEH